MTPQSIKNLIIEAIKNNNFEQLEQILSSGSLTKSDFFFKLMHSQDILQFEKYKETKCAEGKKFSDLEITSSIHRYVTFFSNHYMRTFFGFCIFHHISNDGSRSVSEDFLKRLFSFFLDFANEIDITGKNLLWYAVKSLNIELIKMVISAKSDLNIDLLEDLNGLISDTTFTTKYIARSHNKTLSILQFACDLGFYNLNPDDDFLETNRHKQIMIIEYLLENKANPNFVNSQGHSVLFFAKDNIDIIKTLIKYGVRDNLSSEESVLSNRLYKAGAGDYFSFDNNDYREKIYKIVDLLISIKSDVNFKDKWGLTPLFVAINRSSKKTKKDLIFGAIVNLISAGAETEYKLNGKTYVEALADKELLDDYQLYLSDEKRTGLQKILQIMYIKEGIINLRLLSSEPISFEIDAELAKMIVNDKHNLILKNTVSIKYLVGLLSKSQHTKDLHSWNTTFTKFVFSSGFECDDIYLT